MYVPERWGGKGGWGQDGEKIVIFKDVSLADYTFLVLSLGDSVRLTGH